MTVETDTKQITLVEAEIQGAYRFMFPGGDKTFVPTAFTWALDCFNGNHPDYQRIDALYHDLEHTMQGALCMARLLKGRFVAEVEPMVSQRMFELGLLAILFHDTGYLKKRGDDEGTGAKYTLVHVTRSVEFAQEFLEEHGFSADEIRAVHNMIRCTGVNVDLAAIPFQNEQERIVGFALGTADLLGQMAARDYIDKLPVLYTEFAESAQFNQGRSTGAGIFSSANELMRNTPVFWAKYVLPKIQNDFQGLYRFLNVTGSDETNPYLQRIKANLAALKERLATLPQ